MYAVVYAMPGIRQPRFDPHGHAQYQTASYSSCWNFHVETRQL